MGGTIAAPTARTAAMLRRRSIVPEGKRIAVSPVWFSMTTNGVAPNRHWAYGGVASPDGATRQADRASGQAAHTHRLGPRRNARVRESGGGRENREGHRAARRAAVSDVRRAPARVARGASGDGRRGQGRNDSPRHARHQSPGLSGHVVQGAVRGGSGPRLPVAGGTPAAAAAGGGQLPS